MRSSPVRAGCQVAIVYAVTNGYLDGVAVKDVKKYEEKLYAKLENEYSALLDRLESGFWEAEDVATLKAALEKLR
jgi:F-type H+-transporting ATPase subunit alpha